jgi:hypothetical protein
MHLDPVKRLNCFIFIVSESYFFILYISLFRNVTGTERYSQLM